MLNCTTTTTNHGAQDGSDGGDASDDDYQPKAQRGGQRGGGGGGLASSNPNERAIFQGANSAYLANGGGGSGSGSVEDDGDAMDEGGSDEVVSWVVVHSWVCCVGGPWCRQLEGAIDVPACHLVGS